MSSHSVDHRSLPVLFARQTTVLPDWRCSCDTPSRPSLFHPCSRRSTMHRVTASVRLVLRNATLLSCGLFRSPHLLPRCLCPPPRSSRANPDAPSGPSSRTRLCRLSSSKVRLRWTPLLLRKRIPRPQRRLRPPPPMLLLVRLVLLPPLPRLRRRKPFARRRRMPRRIWLVRWCGPVRVRF